MFRYTINPASFFFSLIAALIFDQGCCGTEQYQSGGRRAGQQHHGQRQHRHRSQRTL